MSEGPFPLGAFTVGVYHSCNVRCRLHGFVDVFPPCVSVCSWVFLMSEVGMGSPRPGHSGQPSQEGPDRSRRKGAAGGRIAVPLSK